jgi:hypothetical protein
MGLTGRIGERMFQIGEFVFKVINDFTKQGEPTPLLVVEDISTEFESCEKDFDVYQSLMTVPEFEKLQKLVKNISIVNRLWRENETNYDEYLTAGDFKKYRIDKYIFEENVEDIARSFWQLDKSSYLLKYYDLFTAGTLYKKAAVTLESELWNAERHSFPDNICLFSIGNKDMERDFRAVANSGCCGSFYTEFEFKGELFGAHCNYGH